MVYYHPSSSVPRPRVLCFSFSSLLPPADTSISLSVAIQAFLNNNHHVATASLASPTTFSPIDGQSSENVAPRPISSASKAASALAAAAAARGGDGAPGSSTIAPSARDAVAAGTAKQQQPPRKLGFFDSLWQLDISYERGKAKE